MWPTNLLIGLQSHTQSGTLVDKKRVLGMRAVVAGMAAEVPIARRGLKEEKQKEKGKENAEGETGASR